MADPTLEGSSNIQLGTTKVKMKVSRNLFAKKVPFTGTDKAIVMGVTGAMRFITIKGVYTASSGLLDTWESVTDFNWSAVAIPEVKVFTASSGETMNVLPDDLEYDRYVNRIEYTLTLIETIKS